MLIITRGNMKIITEDDNSPAEEKRGVWKIKWSQAVHSYHAEGGALLIQKGAGFLLMWQNVLTPALY